jgi:tetratricopeptide (TPR) repeat protein
LLVAELARLRDLYRDVDEKRAVPTSARADKSVDAAIKVEDVSSLLNDAVTAESRLSLGPLAVPVGTLLAIFGRLVQGPQIGGSLHSDGARLILTAQMTGVSKSQVWRVEGGLEAESATGVSAAALPLIEELASRIFADVALSGDVHWKAAYTFCEGLWHYRDCLRALRDRQLKLLKAERKFFETQAEDEQFEQVYYNLGVVYTELGRFDAANDAFERAITQSPDRWEAYYALATITNEPGSLIRLCDRAVTLKANAAPALALKALHQRRTGDLDGAIRTGERAVAYAWRSLCARELTDHTRATAQAEEAILTSLQNLAIAQAYRASARRGLKRWLGFWEASALLRQALFLAPLSSADFNLELGKVYAAWGRDKLAERALYEALKTNPENLDIWSHLAEVQWRMLDARSAATACGHVLSRISEATDDAKSRIAQVYDSLGDQEQRNRVHAMSALLAEISPTDGTDPPETSVLEAKLAEFETVEDRSWERGQLSFALGTGCLDSAPEKAEGYFKAAISYFQPQYPREISRLGVYTMLARAIWGQDERRGATDSSSRRLEALKYADIAFKLSPFDVWERKDLGYSYMELSQYDRARLVLEDALLVSPDDPDLHLWLGICWWSLLPDHRDVAVRKRVLGEAVGYYEHALELYIARATPDTFDAHGISDNEGMALTHYWLGHLYLALEEYGRAVTHLRVSQAAERPKLHATLHLAEALMRNLAYDEAAQEFKRLIANLRRRTTRGAKSKDVLEADMLPQTMTLGELLVWAYWGLCFNSAERDAGRAELLRCLRRIRGQSEQVASIDDVGERAICEASRLDCEGWLLYKLGRAEEAMACLDQSISLHADPEAYLHLALACELLWTDQGGVAGGQESRPLLRRALAACDHAVELSDGRGLSEDASALRTRLQEMNPAAPAGVGAHRGAADDNGTNA